MWLLLLSLLLLAVLLPCGFVQKKATHGQELTGATVHTAISVCKTNQLLAYRQVARRPKLGVVCTGLLALLAHLSNLTQSYKRLVPETSVSSGRLSSDFRINF